MGVELKLAGFIETKASFEALLDVTDRRERALDRAALIVLRAAKRRAPVDSGQMVNTVHIRTELGHRFIVAPTRQALFTEYSHRLLQGATPDSPRTTWPEKERHGSTKNSTMPWLRPALAETRAEVVKLIADATTRMEE